MHISIVIPIYRVEKYLRECVDSILGQTYRDMEIILVDDGSPDMCPQICDEYAEKNCCIKVIHKENGGLSDARNAGIRMARGEYIYFIDSDDYIDNPCLFADIAEIIKRKNPDIVVFAAKKLIGNEIVGDDLTLYSSIERENPIDTICEAVCQDHLSISACSMFVRREYLLEHNLYFVKGIKSEDIEWGFRLYSFIPKVVYYDRRSYIYRIREGSITHTMDFQHMETYYNIIAEKIEFVNRLEGKIRGALLSYAMYHMVILIGLTNTVKMTREQRKSINQKLKVVCKKYLLSNCQSKKTKQAAVLYSFGGFFGLKLALGFFMKIRKS